MFRKKISEADIIVAYVKETAPILTFKLNGTGEIVAYNNHARLIVGELPSRHPFHDLIVQSSGIFDIEAFKESDTPQLLHIKTISAYPKSYLFIFRAFKNETLVFGHSDGDETALMQKEMLTLNQSLSNTTRELHKKNAQLQAALKEIKTLQGIIPICSHCHKIRDDQQIWNQLEAYISEHTDAMFSHGICPECMEKHYPDLMDDM